MGALCGQPCMHMYVLHTQLLCVNAIGNTFSASLLAILGMQSSGSLASLGLLDLTCFPLNKYILETCYFLISAWKLVQCKGSNI